MRMGSRVTIVCFFPEIFRRPMVQTGFLSATIGVWDPVAFGNPSDPS